MLVNELFLASLIFIGCITFVLLLVIFGWYFVWKIYLSRFRFVRELLGGMSDSPSNSAQLRKARIRAETSKKPKLT